MPQALQYSAVMGYLHTLARCTRTRGWAWAGFRSSNPMLLLVIS